MLTVAEIKNTAAREKDYKLADSGGLYLYVTTKGHKSWRLKYRFNGKEHRAVLGSFPSVTLAQARAQRDEVKRLLREGQDPRLQRDRKKLLSGVTTDTFEKLSRDWYNVQRPRWKATHAKDVITSMERDLFPALGKYAIADIDEQMVLAALRSIEARGAIETARRLRQRADAVFRYARAAGYRNINPAAAVSDALAPLPPQRRWPAITEIGELRVLVGRIDDAGASPVTRLASRFLALTAQRPGMVRAAPWSEFRMIDWSRPDVPAPDAVWHVPADRMKVELHLAQDAAFDHIVPLSRHAVEVLHAVRALTGRGPLAFCSSRSAHEPMSENAIGYLYHREGYKGRHVPHGWRSSFSTVMNGLNERLHPGSDRSAVDRQIIDLMLAHVLAGVSATELRYNRSAYMQRRRELATQWANLLMENARPALDLVHGRRRRVTG